jgi:hypothetical protein
MSDDSKKEKNTSQEEKIKTLENAGLAGAAAEVVDLHGSANKEFLVGLSGVDNEIGKTLTKSLEEESRRYYEQVQKIKDTVSDPEQAKKMIHQLQKSHSGYGAEIEEVAQENAKRIINKDPTRRIRMDDLPESEGGKVNHPLYDHADIDKNGKRIPGSESQMKIKGESAKEVHDKLMERGKRLKDGTYKNEKYLDNDVKLKVQKEFADEVREIAKKNIKELEKQEKALSGISGKEKELEKIRRQIFKEKQILKNTEASNVSNQESKDVITKPKRTTAKNIAKISHRAGVEQAKTGAAISGSISLIRNIVSVVKDEKTPEEAALSVVKDIGTGAAVSYATAFFGSVTKGAMQNAKSSTARALAKTNLPATIVTTTLEVGKTLHKYIKGDIDGVKCLEELGEKGTGMLSSAMFATIGQLVIPIPVIGGMIGGMLGYALSSACYGQLMSALKEAKMARERRIQIEKECEEAVRMIREYRSEMEDAISKYLTDYMSSFQIAFDGIETALESGDIEIFIASANAITEKLGGKPQFNNISEFEVFMESEEKLNL